MAHDVFISHSAKDKAIADAACEFLEAKAISCWIAPRDIAGGMEWAGAIVDAIDKSKALILILTSESNESPQVLREAQRAASKKIPIVPLIIEQVTPSKSLEYSISSHHWIDAHATSKDEYLAMLYLAVEKILSEGKEAGSDEKSEEEKVKKALLEREKRKIISNPALFYLGLLLIFVGLALFFWILGSGDLITFDLSFCLLISACLEFFFMVPAVLCLQKGTTNEFRAVAYKGKFSILWWILPVLFGFIGGFIAWFKLKDVNWKGAKHLLTFGVLITVFLAAPIFYFTFLRELKEQVLQQARADVENFESVQEVEKKAKVYTDDFSNPESGWGNYDDDSWESGYRDGEYYFYIKDSFIACSKINAAVGELRNFSLEVDFRFLTDSEIAIESGLLFGSALDADHYIFFVHRDGSYTLVFSPAWQTGSEVAFEIASQTIMSGRVKSKIETGDKIRLKMICKDKKVELYINAEKVGSTMIKDENWWDVGLATYGIDSGGRVVFDNFKVEDLK